MKRIEIILKDWEMTKDRISFFDDVVIRLRLHGIPIATAFQAAALISYHYLKSITFNIIGWKASLPQLIFLFSSLYILPIFALDIFHLKLLFISVNHARGIENKREFKNKISITNQLTSRILTTIHIITACFIYIVVFLFGIIMMLYIK